MATIKKTVVNTRDASGSTETTTFTTHYRFWGELLLLACILGWCVLMFAASQQPEVQVDVHRGAAAAGTDAPTGDFDARTFATLQVYGLDSDDWAQRAAMARATLNAFPAGGSAHELRGGAAAAGPFDPIRWQNALDAVEAVTAGDYPLPLACTRATAAVPSAAAGPGSQCVIGDLAFVEQPR